MFNCFTFLFGEGNPNLNLEDRRLRLIVDTIRAHHGSVIFEQIAPYLDLEPGDLNNEDKILPVLARFNGYPKVTENGNIIYIFETFQTSQNVPQLNHTEEVKELKKSSNYIALNNVVTEHSEPLQSQQTFSETDKYLKAYPWEFCNLSKNEVIPIIIFGFANLFGSIGLLNFFKYLSQPNHLSLAKHFTLPVHLNFLNQFIHANHTNLIQFLTMLTTAMSIYAVVFWLIPVVRWFVLAVFNQIIYQKNLNRENLACKLINPDEKLKTKLIEARNYQSIKPISPNIIYTTQDENLEQEISDLELK